jgi:hypothetical protein
MGSIPEPRLSGAYTERASTIIRLSVDVPGARACRIEYSVVLTDVSSTRFLVEGVNLMRIRDGPISYLRSFEDAPRPIPVGGSASHGREEAENTSGGERT